MPETHKPRMFVKKGPNGEKLTREVTTASSEVEATFDGYHEAPATRSSTSTGGSSSTNKAH